MAAELQPKSSGMIDADVSTINRESETDSFKTDGLRIAIPSEQLTFMNCRYPSSGRRAGSTDWLSSEGTWHRPIHRPENGEDLRPVIVQEFVSLDGVMQAPGDPDEYPRGGWQRPFIARTNWPLLSTR